MCVCVYVREERERVRGGKEETKTIFTILGDTLHHPHSPKRIMTDWAERRRLSFCSAPSRLWCVAVSSGSDTSRACSTGISLSLCSVEKLTHTLSKPKKKKKKAK